MNRHDPASSAMGVSGGRRRGRRGRRLRRARMAKVVPSMLTLGNALSGFAAIVYGSRDIQTLAFGHWSVLTVAAGLIFLGMIFDALDGRVARLTRQTSELGEQLDSMADMVTFGIAPAFLLIQLVGIGTPFFGDDRADTYFDRAVLMIAGVYVACCALRLARFNIEIVQPEESSHMSFKGLPSPAAAGTVAGLVLLHQSLLADHPVVANVTAFGLVLIALLVSVAMVSSMRYVHLLNRYLRGRAPFHYIATAVILLPFVLLIPELTLAAGFSAYALSAPAVLVMRRMRGRKGGGGEGPAPPDEGGAAPAPEQGPR